MLGPDALAGPWARDRVYSRALTIAGGTTQVNKNILAQRILGLPPTLTRREARRRSRLWPLRVGSVSPGASGKWHATNWPGAISRICGSSAAHRSCAFGQRVRNRQPLGGATGDGISPPSAQPVLGPLTFGSGTGIAASSAAVYGCAGCVERVGRADLADLAEVHHDDAVADVLHDREVVGDEDQREPVAVPSCPRAG